MSLTAPGAARAAPTSVPTLVPPRTPSAATSPGPARSPAVFAGSPTPARTPTSLSTSTPTPAPTATPARTPSPAPAADQPAESDSADVEAGVDDWQAFVPTDVADHLATMDRAARDSGCGVPWQLLAAIARVESDFGRNMATSSAGAIGYGQFLPSSWQAFGNDGNVYDYRAALPAIATYLCHSGLASDPRAALFAYNHADWYVDLVLDLAVRYDRMAPGAPTPDVLAVNPSDDQSIPMHYAPGRDVRLEARARALEGPVGWLGVPWRGRLPGSAISVASLETTTLAMLRAAFGLTGDTPRPTEDPPDLVTSLAERAWVGELFANPRPLGKEWSVAEIRQRIERGQSVVAVLNSRLLPGHPTGESAATGDQPVLVIGSTPDGLVYSDPSFSSSLGYGLELDDATFGAAWQAASTPLQALALSTRPEPPLRDDHRLEPRSRVIPSAVPTPAALPAPVPTPAPEPEAPLPYAAVDVRAIDEDTAQPPSLAQPEPAPDRSWMILAGAAVLLVGVFGLRRICSRRLT